MRFWLIFCQILSGEWRYLLSYSVRKMLFLSHNKNIDSNLSPKFVSSNRVMPISASFGLLLHWMKPTASSCLEKEKCEDTCGISRFFYGITVTALLGLYFHEGVWDEGVKTREDSKAGPVLAPAFHNMRRCHKAKHFGTRRTFSFMLCCDTTSHSS